MIIIKNILLIIQILKLDVNENNEVFLFKHCKSKIVS